MLFLIPILLTEVSFPFSLHGFGNYFLGTVFTSLSFFMVGEHGVTGKVVC